MIFEPHENEINFDPEVRLRQMEAEREFYRDRPKFSVSIGSYKDHYNRCIEASRRAIASRNRLGGMVVATLVGGNTAEGINLIPDSLLTTVAIGGVLGVMASRARFQHEEAKTQRRIALLDAAQEVAFTPDESDEVPHWAHYALQEAGKTADEVLSNPFE